MLDLIPDAWGPKFVAEDGGVTWTRTGPSDIAFTSNSNLAMIMLAPQPRREIALGGSRRSVGLAPAGTVEIVPAGADVFCGWSEDKESIVLSVRPERLSRLALVEFGRDDFYFRPPGVGLVDPTAFLLARLTREELARGEGANDLCLDSLMTVLSTHLLRAHSSLGDHLKRRHVGGLSPRAWKLVSEYIDAHLATRIVAQDLAELVGLSPSHFLRAFRATCGQPPHRYVISRRIAFAEHLIRSTGLPFAIVADRAGFASNSHMTSMMRRVRGYVPKELRRRG